MTNYLGIDLGEKRIGLAIGSTESRLARPIGVIEHRSRKSDISAILEIIRKNDVNNIVIGASYEEDGNLNSMGRHAVSFGSDLQDACGLKVDYHDEALSTMDARTFTLHSGHSMKQRRGHQDAMAAAVILQSYFDNTGSA